VRVAVVADDLIWATRLADLVRGAGAVAVPVRTMAGLDAALAGCDAVIVDLTARAYDGIAAIAAAHAAGRRILAVGQHDDAELRRRAVAAGADRVHPYRRLFEDGPRQLARWLATADQPAESPA
jgi:DNA-binding NarL/FixJ family response regulator